MYVPKFTRRWRVAAPAAAVAAVALTWAGYAATSQTPTSAADPTTVGIVRDVGSSAPLATVSYADTVAKALPAVVTVQVEKRAERGASPMMQLPDDPFFRRFFGPSAPDGEEPPSVERGLGSGVIITGDGTILTNNHVVDGAEYLTVTLSDGRTLPAKVIGTDAPTDLAVIDVDAEGLPTLPMADSSRIRVGDVVLAVGNPLGIGQTVTMGIVSAKGRATGDADSYQDFLQTDAPINRGNSGGALITTGGELVGINSQIVSPTGGNIGIGFAIPSNLAKNVMNQLISTGKVRRGQLGVLAQGVTSDLAESLGLSSVHGALVSEVQPNTPAARAGVRQGDVIVRVDGLDVRDSNDLRNRISSTAPGQVVALDIVRNGREQTLRATLGEVAAGEHEAAPASESKGELGMTLAPLTPQLANRFRLEGNPTGVVISEIEAGSVAARAGLRPGDILRKVDGSDVTSPAQARQALGQSRTRPALVMVEREGNPLFVAVPTR